VSVITDLGGKDVTEVPTHEEVQRAAEEAQPRMMEIMRELIRQA
jgi:purine-nucleoside phosphorylase